MLASGQKNEHQADNAPRMLSHFDLNNVVILDALQLESRKLVIQIYCLTLVNTRI